MKLSDLSLKKEEKAVFLLRSLFEQYGYSQFKMNKFEEYDLYVRNKDFLISDSIITFTDTNGKLMALKPDVTLSIVKNSMGKSGGVEKVYYDENVYRISGGTHSFKEIMQVGIECIGAVDDYCIAEVLMLAAKSLRALSEDSVLDLSHFGMVTWLIDSFGVTSEVKRSMLSAIGEKNLHELSAVCKRAQLSAEKEALLTRLIATYGKPSQVLPELRSFLTGIVPEEFLDLLAKLCKQLEKLGFGDMIRIDFSVVNHTDYYNGIVFKGFVKGIPTGVLSGGQYDRLMQKMGRFAGAVGFAVYLDLLEALPQERKEYDMDVLLLYSPAAPMETVLEAVQSLQENGCSVMAQKERPNRISFREVYQLTESGVTCLERNA